MKCTKLTKSAFSCNPVHALPVRFCRLNFIVVLLYTLRFSKWYFARLFIRRQLCTLLSNSCYLPVSFLALISSYWWYLARNEHCQVLLYAPFSNNCQFLLYAPFSIILLRPPFRGSDSLLNTPFSLRPSLTPLQTKRSYYSFRCSKLGVTACGRTADWHIIVLEKS